jgi:L-lysine exporter family protein LysE/ArgO
MTFIKGFLLGLSLIMAIGAQNAYVLRAGLRKTHVFAICLFCALSDAVLIAVGITGMGAVLGGMQDISFWLYLVASGWLFGYGLLRLRDALRGQSGLNSEGGTDRPSLPSALLMAAALTWLNPHVYLDTVVLLGGIASTLGPAERLSFGTGAALASFIFFFGLGYGARAVCGYLTGPASWKKIDLGIALIMFWLATGFLTAEFRL